MHIKRLLMDDLNFWKDRIKKWHEDSYKVYGFRAQRRFPNEELIRFLARNYLNKFSLRERNKIKILELGCGSCANLWMAAREGFSASGIDLSPESLKLGQEMLNAWSVEAELIQGSFLNIPLDNESFDIVFDVFAIHTNDDDGFNKTLDETVRLLKSDGMFFSYTPGIASDAYKNYQPSDMIDKYTLDGIKREDAPYRNNDYPFHFISPQDYKNRLESRGMEVNRVETVIRTYNNLNENFQHVVIEATKH